MRGRVFRNYYKAHMDKTKGQEWKQGREVGLAGVGRVVESKCRQLYLNNNKVIFLKKKERKTGRE